MYTQFLLLYLPPLFIFSTSTTFGFAKKYNKLYIKYKQEHTQQEDIHLTSFFSFIILVSRNTSLANSNRVYINKIPSIFLFLPSFIQFIQLSFNSFNSFNSFIHSFIYTSFCVYINKYKRNNNNM